MFENDQSSDNIRIQRRQNVRSNSVISMKTGKIGAYQDQTSYK